MFSTGLSTILVIFAGFSVVFLIALWVMVENNKRRFRAVMRYVEEHNAEALSRSKLADIESTLTELSDSYSTLLTSVKKLGARARARAARETPRENGLDLSAMPHNDAEKAAYKAKLREQLRKEGRL